MIILHPFCSTLRSEVHALHARDARATDVARAQRRGALAARRVPTRIESSVLGAIEADAALKSRQRGGGRKGRRGGGGRALELLQCRSACLTSNTWAWRRRRRTPWQQRRANKYRLLGWGHVHWRPRNNTHWWRRRMTPRQQRAFAVEGDTRAARAATHASAAKAIDAAVAARPARGFRSYAQPFVAAARTAAANLCTVAHAVRGEVVLDEWVACARVLAFTQRRGVTAARLGSAAAACARCTEEWRRLELRACVQAPAA